MERNVQEIFNWLIIFIEIFISIYHFQYEPFFFINGFGEYEYPLFGYVLYVWYPHSWVSDTDIWWYNSEPWQLPKREKQIQIRSVFEAMYLRIRYSSEPCLRLETRPMLLHRTGQSKELSRSSTLTVPSGCVLWAHCAQHPIGKNDDVWVVCFDTTSCPCAQFHNT